MFACRKCYCVFNLMIFQSFVVHFLHNALYSAIDAYLFKELPVILDLLLCAFRASTLQRMKCS
ncbi:uncharacterized protein Dmul_05370 [Desulfococcus multivorans]|nr:uncharacterized protein Dmul_05370 [Desulfococcus multivorans]